MGFFGKIFGEKVVCPECGTPGAQQNIVGIKCVMKTCRNFDHHYALKNAAMDGEYYSSAPDRNEPEASTDMQNSGFAHPVTVEYMNFRNQKKVFVCNGDTMRIRRKHVGVSVAPTGKMIYLKISKIVNKDAIKDARR